jgi:hypothetical protein
VTVTLPMTLTTEILRAVRQHPTTSIDDKEEEHRRIGWLQCAWDVIVTHRVTLAHEFDVSMAVPPVGSGEGVPIAWGVLMSNGQHRLVFTPEEAESLRKGCAASAVIPLYDKAGRDAAAADATTRGARICRNLMRAAEINSGPEAAGWLDQAANHIAGGAPSNSAIPWRPIETAPKGDPHAPGPHKTGPWLALGGPGWIAIGRHCRYWGDPKSAAFEAQGGDTFLHPTHWTYITDLAPT